MAERKHKRRLASRRPARRPLTLELLEPRLIPALFTWDGGGDGLSWTDPANWDRPGNNLLPGVADDVVINTPGELNVVYDAAVTTIRSLNNADTVTINGGALTISQDSTLSGALTVAGGSLTLDGLTLSGTGVLRNQALLTATSSTINPTFTNEGTLIVPSGTTDVTGPFSNAAGSICVRGHNGLAHFAVAGGFANSGAIELTSANAGYGAQITVAAGTLTNAPSGTIEAQAGAGGPRTLTAQLDNQGTLTVGMALTISRAAADHTNSGAIQVGAGNLTVSQSGATPSFTNTGAITLAGGRTFAVSGGAFSQDAGSIAGAGTLSFTSAVASFATDVSVGAPLLALSHTTLAGAGTLTVPAGQTLTAHASTIGMPLINEGTLIIPTGTTTIDGPFTTAAGSVVRLQAQNGAADLVVAAGFTNHGAIEMTNLSAGYASSLTVNGGPLVNAPGALIDVIANLGGGRTINAELNNQGALTVGIATTLARAGADHSSTGLIELTGGNLTLTQSGATPTFTSTGTITLGAGRTFAVQGGAFQYGGGTISGAGTLSLTSLNANLAADLNMDAALTLNTTTVNGPGSLTVPAGRTATAASSTIQPAIINQGTVIVATGASAFSGPFTSAPGSTLRLRSQIGEAELTVAAGFVNRGSIELTSADAGYSTELIVITGVLSNAAGATIETQLGAGGARTLTAGLDNQGTFTVSGPTTLAQAAADHTCSGVIDLAGANLTVTQTGATPSFTNTGTINLGAGRTLTVSGGRFDHQGVGLGGPGTLDLAGVTSTFTALASPGILSLRAGSQLTYPADLSTATTLVQISASTLSLAGTLTNTAGQTLTLSAAVINGAVDNLGTLVVRTGVSTINGLFTTGPDATLRLLSQSGEAHLTVGSFTNYGDIELTSVDTTNATRFAVTGGPLVNAVGATIAAQAGAGGARTLAAALDNRGTLTIGAPLTLSSADADHVSSGLIDVLGGNLTLTQTGVTPTFTNTGTTNLGAGRTLAVSGGRFDHQGAGLGGPGTLDLDTVASTFTAAANLSTLLLRDGSVLDYPADLSTGDTAVQLMASTLNIAGTLTNAAGRTIPLDAGIINGAVHNQGTLLIRTGTSSINGAFTTEPGSTLRLLSQIGEAHLTTPGFTNHGTIELTSTGASYTTRLTVAGGALVNAPGATIEGQPGIGGDRILALQLDNQGTLTANAPMTLSAASADHTSSGAIHLAGGNLTVTQTGTTPTLTNTGTIDIGAGRTLLVSGGRFDHQAGILGGPGTLDFDTVAGTFTVSAALGTLSLRDGTVLDYPTDLSTADTALTISSATLNIAGSLINPAGRTLALDAGVINGAVNNQSTLLIRSGTSSINGPLTTAPGSVVRIQGQVGLAHLVVGGGFTNNGAIELTNAIAGYDAQLTVSGGNLTNAPGALIDVQAGLGGSRTLTGTLDNQGTLTVAAGRTLAITGGGLANFAAGTLSGGVYNLAGSLRFPGANITTNAATLVLDGSASGIVDAAGADGLRNFLHNSPQGSLTLRGGRDLSTGLRTSLLGSFNPGLGGLVGIAFDPASGPSGSVFLYPSFGASIHEFTADGTAVLPTIPRPGVPSDDFDLDIAPSAVNIGGTPVPAGTLLVLNAQVNPNVLFGIDKDTGAILASVSLEATFLVGAALHPARGTIFAVDYVAEQVREIDPANGATLASFPVQPAGSPAFDMNFGDVAVDETTGNLYLVSSQQAVVRELSATGTFVRDVSVGALGINSMAGVAVDSAHDEIWIATLGGGVYRLGFDRLFTNAGAITLEAGSTLSSDLGYVQATTGTLNLAIGGSSITQVGGIHSNGAAELAGTLNVSVTGGFLPADGEQFLLIDAAERLGQFATIGGLDVGGGIVFEPLYTPTGLTLLARGTQGNQPPDAVDDAVSTPEDTAVTFDVLANDTDLDSDPVEISSYTQPATGTLVRNADGGFTYTPAANHSAAVSFTYDVRDGRGGVDSATVTITVVPVNDGPTTAPVGPISTPEDTDVTITLAGNDVENDPLTFRISRLPARGVLYQTADGVTRGAAIATAGTIVTNPGRRVIFAPAPDTFGHPYASFGFIVSDGQADSAERMVHVSVQFVNDPPAADADAATTPAATPVNLAVLANDTDLDLDTLRIQSVNTTGSAGSVTINPGSLTLRYTPDPGFLGVDTFTYTAHDNRGGTATAMVEVTVEANDTADLVVSAISVPPGAVIGNPAQVAVTWTVRNLGPVAGAVAQWTDQVRFSASGVIDDANDVTLGSFVHIGALAPITGSYTETRTVSLPAAHSGAGFVYVRTDALRQVPEFMGEGNNPSVLVGVDVILPFVDLLVEAVAVTPPATSGALLPVSWRVRNQGNSATTVAGWVDRLVLSDDGSLDPGDDELARVPRSGALAADGSYTAQALVRLPDGTSGSRHIFVIADFDGAVAETDETNNDDGRTPTPFSVTRLPDPNLVVTAVSSPATTGRPGATISVTWTIDNIGLGIARGPWLDRIYLSRTGSVTGATLLKTVQRTGDLAPDPVPLEETTTVLLPSVPDGTDYRLLVVTDAGFGVFEDNDEDDNVGASDTIVMGHPNLAPVLPSFAGRVLSGGTLPLAWTVENRGLVASGPWIDRVYLSANTDFDGGDRLLGEFSHPGIAPLSSVPGFLDAFLLVELSGPFFILIRTDPNNTIDELTEEHDNDAAQALQIDLAPYADLRVTSVTAPTQLIDDPAEITVTWIVDNMGTGGGLTHTWVDAVIARDIFNGHETPLYQRTHTGGLAPDDEPYEETATFLLPAAFSGRFEIAVRTDYTNVVFENRAEINNRGAGTDPLDVMPIRYADLIVTALDADTSAGSGGFLPVTWTVRNQGIGTTDAAGWNDLVQLARNPDGTDLVVGAHLLASHVGTLAPGGEYTRTGFVPLPNGATGTFYVVVQTDTGGAFEHIYESNNRFDPPFGPVTITLTDAPDLFVVDDNQLGIVLPPTAAAGTLIDVTWGVRNRVGGGAATGAWVDKLVLQPIAGGHPIILGSFTTTRTLLPGEAYTRTEHLRLPENIPGVYQLHVTTNADGSVYEHGIFAENNVTADDNPLVITLPPHPDLQVVAASGPDRVAAGGSVRIEFTVRNQGTVATSAPHWEDRVYLSVDNRLTSDDRLVVPPLANLSALAAGQAYARAGDQAVTFTVDRVLRGSFFVLIQTDAGDTVNEFPQEGNNVFNVLEIFVEAPPPADLVVSDVVAPTQAFAGSTISVTFTVTNRGVGETNANAWSDAVWLAKERTRPDPAGPASIRCSAPSATPAASRWARADSGPSASPFPRTSPVSS